MHESEESGRLHKTKSILTESDRTRSEGLGLQAVLPSDSFCMHGLIGGIRSGGVGRESALKKQREGSKRRMHRTMTEGKHQKKDWFVSII
jgi:hypothetical protein